MDPIEEAVARAADLERQLEEAHAILSDFVRETDAWNAAMEKIIGHRPGYCWQTLERARSVCARLAALEKETDHGPD